MSIQDLQFLKNNYCFLNHKKQQNHKFRWILNMQQHLYKRIDHDLLQDFMTYKNFCQLCGDSSVEHILRFHTPQMGNTFGRKVEQHKKVVNMF